MASLNQKYQSTEYHIWEGMKSRCLNPNHVAYHRYGGRGISVCKSWLVFDNFYRDMGNRPSRAHFLERIDNNKGYSKSNCKWATIKEQSRNKASNQHITYNGRTATLAEWAEITGMLHATLRWRKVIKGWSDEKVITTPLRSHIRREGNHPGEREVIQQMKGAN